MEELTPIQLLCYRLLYFIGWLINQLSRIFIGYSSGQLGFDSPLLWLTFGLFFAFACLHIFKRILRKD